jgi:hypothetical protein
MMPTTRPTRIGVSAVGYIMGTRSSAWRHHGCATARSSLGWCFLQGSGRRQHERCLRDFRRSAKPKGCTFDEQRHDKYHILLQTTLCCRCKPQPHSNFHMTKAHACCQYVIGAKAPTYGRGRASAAA